MDEKQAMFHVEPMGWGVECYLKGVAGRPEKVPGEGIEPSRYSPFYGDCGEIGVDGFGSALVSGGVFGVAWVGWGEGEDGVSDLGENRDFQQYAELQDARQEVEAPEPHEHAKGSDKQVCAAVFRCFCYPSCGGTESGTNGVVNAFPGLVLCLPFFNGPIVGVYQGGVFWLLWTGGLAGLQRFVIFNRFLVSRGLAVVMGPDGWFRGFKHGLLFLVALDGREIFRKALFNAAV